MPSTGPMTVRLPLEDIEYMKQKAEEVHNIQLCGYVRCLIKAQIAVMREADKLHSDEEQPNWIFNKDPLPGLEHKPVKLDETRPSKTTFWEKFMEKHQGE